MSEFPVDSQSGHLDLFKESEQAAQYSEDPEFQEIYDILIKLAEEEESRTDEAAPDLPPEQDDGNTEYKLKLCELTMYKVKKRTT